MGFKNIIIALSVSLAIICTGCSHAENDNTSSELNKPKELSKSNELNKSEETEKVVVKKEVKEENGVILPLDNEKLNLCNEFQNKELSKLSLKELSLLRNSIYAKHGYKFSTKEFNEYFSQFSWYKPLGKDIDEKLNEIDRKNIENIISFEKTWESRIKNSKDNKDGNDGGQLVVSLDEKLGKESKVYITTYKLNNVQGGNNPTKVTLIYDDQKLVFESTWNDGIFFSVVDFDDKDNEVDVYITETGTDIQCTTHIYKITDKDIYEYASFTHFGKDFLYDEKGNIYYWYNTADKMEFNTYLNYRTKESSNIWDDSIKNRLNNLPKDIETSKENTEETSSSEKDDEKVKVADLNYYKDLDNDGNQEEINVVFKANDVESSYVSTEYTISIKSNGKTFKYEEPYVYVWNCQLIFLHLKDKTYFYVQDEGPSDDPNATIFELSKDGINKVFNVGGYITDYDYSEGNIYTTFSYTNDKNKVLLTYYNIEAGLKYPKREEVIGKYLQYDSKMTLFKKENPEGVHRVSWGDSQFDYKDGGVVKVTDINEPLKIVDIDYNPYEGHSGIVRNIPIKVETQDGLTGWLFWLNGGD